MVLFHLIIHITVEFVGGHIIFITFIFIIVIVVVIIIKIFTVKVKGKVVPVLSTEHHVVKAYWGSEGIAPRIL
jgi:hypothetical protein